MEFKVGDQVKVLIAGRYFTGIIEHGALANGDIGVRLDGFEGHNFGKPPNGKPSNGWWFSADAITPISQLHEPLFSLEEITECST